MDSTGSTRTLENILSAHSGDISLYIDASGSVAPGDHRLALAGFFDALRRTHGRARISCTGFSHVLGNTYTLDTEDWNSNYLAADVEDTVVKGGGGLSIENVWEHINTDAQRREQLSFVVSDFMFYIPKAHAHPENLHYLYSPGKYNVETTRDAVNALEDALEWMTPEGGNLIIDTAGEHLS